MKTTLQKAIEAVKDYRDLGTADVDTCNAILLQLAALLPEEKEQTIQFMYDCMHDLLHSVGDGWELAKAPEIYFNEYFDRRTTDEVKIKEESKQELPQIGTKEFNDVVSAYFGRT